jgi:NAD(P)-dependent dehydrogenase (short-subunit alcohol dehydrogenase family)
VDRVTPWASRRVLVTGATGIVGSWLVRKLVEDGAFVVGLVRDMNPQSELIRSGLWRRMTIVNGALEDYRAVERAVVEHEVDSVFHLAAQAIVTTAFRSPLATFEANIRGTYNLLDACRVSSSRAATRLTENRRSCLTRRRCRSPDVTRTTSARVARICSRSRMHTPITCLSSSRGAGTFTAAVI